jgi:2-succinyl-6-hydroxy-2,4-cyclohexadiene-1-carboxylate synthase
LTERLDIDVGEDLRLSVAVGGAGDPLLLLHGFTGSAETWDPFRSRFETAYRVAALDLPGHGGSSAPADAERYSLPRFADDIARLLDAMRIERTALLGYSLGGRAALHFAAAHGDRLTALVLESCSPGLADEKLREERRRSDEELAEFIERQGITAFVDHWESLSLWETQRSLTVDARSQLRRQRLRNDVRGLAGSLRGAGVAAHPFLAERLADIDVPTLLIAGEMDAKYAAIARKMEGSMRNARTLIIPDAGHAVHLEQPEAFAHAVLDFLSEVPAIRQHEPHV